MSSPCKNGPFDPSHPFPGHYNRSPSYNMVSPNDPTANACKVVDFHGEKIASFNIHGKTMLCLPQAFDIFLKNLVGGLHTVYTKCKRLDIHPLVCNVEQVRATLIIILILVTHHKCIVVVICVLFYGNITVCNVGKFLGRCGTLCVRIV